MSSIVFVV